MLRFQRAEQTESTSPAAEIWRGVVFTIFNHTHYEIYKLSTPSVNKVGIEN